MHKDSHYKNCFTLSYKFTRRPTPICVQLPIQGGAANRVGSKRIFKYCGFVLLGRYQK